MAVPESDQLCDTKAETSPSFAGIVIAWRVGSGLLSASTSRVRRKRGHARKCLPAVANASAADDFVLMRAATDAASCSLSSDLPIEPSARTIRPRTAGVMTSANR